MFHILVNLTSRPIGNDCHPMVCAQVNLDRGMTMLVRLQTIEIILRDKNSRRVTQNYKKKFYLHVFSSF